MIYFPYILQKSVDAEFVSNWNSHYQKKVDKRDCFKEEGLWRRSQENINQTESGWSCNLDKRRRIIHYEHEFGLIQNKNSHDFAAKNLYVWLNYALPENEMDHYYGMVSDQSLQFYGWDKVERNTYKFGDLYVKYEMPCIHEQDRIYGRIFPKQYQFLDVTFFSSNNNKDGSFREKPWLVLKTGIREKKLRGNPHITDNVCDILKYLPAQIELGGAASIDSGIYPLHFLHDVYSVCDKNKSFVFSCGKDDFFRSMIEKPNECLQRVFEMQKKISNTRPNIFYKILREMYDKKKIVGPVITNNFDGLIRQVGLSERYVRRYSDNIYPAIRFHPSAKSLIIIGAHADRRRIQERARKKGLKIIYIDPEGYYDENKIFNDYLIEAPQDEDVILRMSAVDAFKDIKKALNI